MRVLQRTAYHETSHARAAIRFGQEFERVVLYNCPGGEKNADGAGQLLGRRTPILYDGLEELLIVLAGWAANKIMRPHWSCAAIMFDGVRA